MRTGIAVRAGEALPDIATPDALKASLLAASAIYFPDPQRATAGIHFASVLDKLGIRDAVAPRLRTFANGATAMHELATSVAPGAIGCTQITEIKYTPGIALVGPLPAAFELATVYAAALGAQVQDAELAQQRQAELAQRFVDLLAGPETRALRVDAGFEIDESLQRGSSPKT